MKKKGQKRMQTATDTVAAQLAETKLRLDKERRALEISASVKDPRAFTVPDVDRQMGETIYREPLISATVTLRDDPLGHMHRKGRDDTRIGSAQYHAGRVWQRTYEAAGIGRIRSPGDIREPVDGGGIAHSGATDRQMQAHKRLAMWRALLGTQGALIIEDVLAEKRTLRQVAQARYGGTESATIKYVGRRFRECLSTLAKDMGLSS